MALFEEASPICRGKNLSWETILLFYNNMPRKAMPKAQFHAYTEAKIDSWTTTHSQIARQLAFYYEKDGICYPRFIKEMSYADLFKYMQNWAAKYFVPNPYAPSLKDYQPTCIYSAILKAIDLGESNFDTILDSIFGISLSSHDKVRVYLNNFTNLIIDDTKQVSINNRTFGIETILHPDVTCATDAQEYFDYFSIESEIVAQSPRNVNMISSLQQIFYGAPGTGKSHGIKDNDDVKSADAKNLVFRTTFHPDSDYSTFVGAYKPTMRPVADKYKAVAGKDEEIAYSFVPQAFLQAYVAAWNNPDEKVFLVIEEINRGNCAQIFGDLFQLLDRDEDGNSEYPIVADMDLAKYLRGKDENDRDILENKDGLKDGKLKLPKNLYIWATMNTSDQSLFPIDSAFKRRWDWKYMPIADGKKDWKIEVAKKQYDWWQFLQKINEQIGKTTNSEDKKLGYYFCKTKDGIIDAETFVGKVVFYLWNDVFKDFAEEAGCVFKDADDSVLSFNKFYTVGEDGKTKVVEEKVELFLRNLGVEAIDAIIDEEDEEDSETTEGKDYTRYTINGEGSIPKRQLSTQAVRKYIELNPELTPEQVVANWMSLGNIVSHFVETKEQFDARTDNSKRSLEVPCGDTIIYVAWNGWGIGNKMQTLIDSVNNKDWGIKLAIKDT